MEESQRKWEQCLAAIRERVNNERIYNVWFADVAIDSYDAEQNVVVLRVPSRYVYEYLEMFCQRLMSEILLAAFGSGFTLRYRVLQERGGQQPSGTESFQGTQTIPHVAVENARKRMEDGLRYFIGDSCRWLPDYDRVAEWLADNKGRGLLLVGTPGLGKTCLCSKVLAAFLAERKIRYVSVSAQEMNQRIDELMKERCIIIDDLGKEPVETRTYGNRRTPFFELCDAAERQGKLLIITTNLSTTPKPAGLKGPWPYPTSIEERYGSAVISRLRAITRAIKLEGSDMRR